MEAAAAVPPPEAPPAPMPKTEAQSCFGRESVGTLPLEGYAPENGLGGTPAITVYTSNGKHSIAPDGNFGKNTDFSTPADRYTKALMK
jgi:hypothetical protein